MKISNTTQCKTAHIDQSINLPINHPHNNHVIYFAHQIEV